MEISGWMPELSKEGIGEYLQAFNKDPVFVKNIHILCAKLVENLGSEADQKGPLSLPFGKISDVALKKSLADKAKHLAHHLSYLSTLLNVLRIGGYSNERIDHPIITPKSKNEDVKAKTKYYSEVTRVEEEAYGMAIVGCSGLFDAVKKENYEYFISQYGYMLVDNPETVRKVDYDSVLETSLLLFFFYVKLAILLPVGFVLRMDSILSEISWAVGLFARELQEQAYQHNLKISQNTGRGKGRKAQNRDIIEQAIFRIGAGELRSMNKPYSRANKIRKYLECEGIKPLPSINTIVDHWKAIVKERGWTQHLSY